MNRKFLIILFLSCVAFAGCYLFEDKPTKEELAKIEAAKIEAEAQADIARQKAQEDAKTAPTILGEKLIWIILGCVVGVIIAVVLVFRGNIEWALALGAGCAVGLVVAVSVWQQFAWLARYGLAVIGISVGGAIIFVLWRAVPQLTKTGEVAKEHLSLAERNSVFGSARDDHGLAGDIQSSSTEKLVAKARRKM